MRGDFRTRSDGQFVTKPPRTMVLQNEIHKPEQSGQVESTAESTAAVSGYHDISFMQDYRMRRLHEATGN